MQQIVASPETVSIRRCDPYEAAGTGHVDAWRMHNEALQTVVRGSRSRTHVEARPTSSACCR